MQVKNINEAIKIMKEKCTDVYAQAYLEAIPVAIDEEGKNGLIYQLRYALANTQDWKGIEATQVKKFIRNWLRNTSKV
jgi:hypothetical protein